MYMIETQAIEPIKKELEPSDELAKAGLHFGHRTSKTHPLMKPYIAGVKNTVHVFDLAKTKEKLQEAADFITKLVGEGKVVLLVGTKIQIQQKMQEVGESTSLPYVSKRWIGGTLTNFETLLKRISLLKDLQEKKEKGELSKYTKKEQGKIKKELELFEEKFGGIKNMSRLPDALFVCDACENLLAIREAKRIKIPVIAIVDTNCDPSLVDYVIPANDDAVSSVSYILEQVQKAVEKGKLQSKATEASNNE